MVFVKVRETYDLHTLPNKLSLIAIHTPDPEIIRRNWSGLLMNCKFYRPVSCDVRMACASVLPVDPLGVGLTEGDIAPEDLFNPILYKACTNESFSLLETRILALGQGEVNTVDVSGKMAQIDSDNVTPYEDDFGVYYGLLADAHGWRHASPQTGLEMKGLKPLVHEVLYSFGGAFANNLSPNPNFNITSPAQADPNDPGLPLQPRVMRGKAQPMPKFPTTEFPSQNKEVLPGFESTNGNSETLIPFMRTIVGGIVMPPSRLHQMFYRMVVEWTIEFTEIRSIIEIAGWAGLNSLGENTHFQSYDFSANKLIDETKSMASANVDIEKVM